MAVNGIDPYHQFLALHKNQLESSVVPEHFWPTLYKKITEDVSSEIQLEICVKALYCQIQKMPLICNLMSSIWLQWASNEKQKQS